ncbi:MAG: imelysin family protein [Putridiphycobacter sp.]|nr:imelysin family protein [Putridiphycobacter sp.]
MRIQHTILMIICLFFTSLSCEKECKTDCDDTVDFDRKEMVTDITTHYILPAYNTYLNETNSLSNQIDVFVTNPSVSALANCRDHWQSTITAWQSIAFLEFGPAENIGLRSQTNLFPVDTSKIKENINSGNSNLALPSNYVAKGLQSVDYLLYIPNMPDSNLVAYYENSSSAAAYLKAVADELKQNAAKIHTEWQTYQTDFNENTTNNAQGSAVSDIVNALSSHYETFVRKGKVGIPLGVFNGFTQTPMPAHVESYFSEYSNTLLISQMEAMHQFLNGVGIVDNTERMSLNDYADFVEAKKDNQKLSAAINSQIATIIDQVKSLEMPLQQAVIDQPETCKTLYESMQKLVPLLKVDLTSALGVLITYQDNDGD